MNKNVQELLWQMLTSIIIIARDTDNANDMRSLEAMFRATFPPTEGKCVEPTATDPETALEDCDTIGDQLWAADELIGAINVDLFILELTTRGMVNIADRVEKKRDAYLTTKGK